MNLKNIRRLANEGLKKNIVMHYLMLIVFALLSAVMSIPSAVGSFLYEYLFSFNPVSAFIVLLLFAILSAVLSYALSIGLSKYYINVVRDDSPAMDDFFAGLRYLGDSAKIMILSVVYFILYAIVAVILVFLLSTVIPMLLPHDETMAIAVVIPMLVGYIYMFCVTYSFRLITFVAADCPEMTATAIVRRAMRLMKHNKFNLFLIDLPFMLIPLVFSIVDIFVFLKAAALFPIVTIIFIIAVIALIPKWLAYNAAFYDYLNPNSRKASGFDENYRIVPDSDYALDENSQTSFQSDFGSFSTSKKCSVCGEINNENAAFCNKCGSKLE